MYYIPEKIERQNLPNKITSGKLLVFDKQRALDLIVNEYIHTFENDAELRTGLFQDFRFSFTRKIP